MIRNKHIAVALSALAVVALAACGGHQSHSVHVLATSSAVRADAQTGIAILAKDGVPVHGSAAQQIAFGRTLMTKSGRKALAVKLAIPKANRPAFEAAVLNAAEHDHLRTEAGWQQFISDLAADVTRYQGATR